MDLSRLAIKVVFKSRAGPEAERRLIRMQPHTGVYDCRVLPVGIRLLLDPWG
jgi:hypothetical protein